MSAVEADLEALRSAIAPRGCSRRRGSARAREEGRVQSPLLSLSISGGAANLTGFCWTAVTAQTYKRSPRLSSHGERRAASGVASAGPPSSSLRLYLLVDVDRPLKLDVWP